jgi:hypothetical protein
MSGCGDMVDHCRVQYLWLSQRTFDRRDYWRAEAKVQKQSEGIVTQGMRSKPD